MASVAYAFQLDGRTVSRFVCEAEPVLNALDDSYHVGIRAMTSLPGRAPQHRVHGVVVVPGFAMARKVTAVLPLLFTAVLVLTPAMLDTPLMLGRARAHLVPGRGRHRRSAHGRHAARRVG